MLVNILVPVLIVTLITLSAQLRGDLEFYQGAFESYKSQLQQEIEDKWKKKEDELGKQHQEEMQKKIHEVRE